MEKLFIVITYFALTIVERIEMIIKKINHIFEHPKTGKIGFVVAVLIYLSLILFTLFSNGCSANGGSNNFETLYKNSQASLQVSNNLLIQEKSLSALAEKQYRQSEKLLRDSIDSLFVYSKYKTDSLFTVIEVKNILLRSNDANIDTMLFYINKDVLNYILLLKGL